MSLLKKCPSKMRLGGWKEKAGVLAKNLGVSTHLLMAALVQNFADKQFSYQLEQMSRWW